ncbi:MAG: hypothetical protein SangKO_061810 [Sandaracinaceae bacterium]
MRSSLIFSLVALSGCSLVLDPGSLQGGGTDSGRTDASVTPDATTDAGDDAGLGDGGDGGDAGEVGCVAPRMMCGDSCVDTATSDAHCGACDNACDAEQRCVDSSCRPAFVGAVRFGAAEADSVRGVALDATGNAYLAVEVRMDVDLGGGTLSSMGDSDIAVLSLAPDGSFRWAVRFGGPGQDSARGIAFHPSTGLVVAGEFSGTIDVGTGPLVSAGGDDLLIAALDPADGSTRWARRHGGLGDERVFRAAFSPTGVLYVAGLYGGGFTFAGSPLVTGGDVDALLLSFDSDASGASERWAFTVAGTGRDTVEGVASDATGNLVCAVGMFSDVVVIDGSPVTSSGGTDGYVVCLDATGGVRWVDTVGGTGPDQLGGVAIGSDFVAATGAFSGEAMIGGTLRTAQGMFDGLVVAYSIDGTPRWGQPLASSGEFDFGLQASVGSDDRTYVVGLFQGAVTVDGVTLPHAGDFDAFLGVFMPSGDLDWARSFGGALNEGFLDVAQAASGQLWVTGEMQSDTDYGGGVLTSAGDYDGVVVRYLP